MTLTDKRALTHKGFCGSITIMSNTDEAERLRAYHNFDDDVLERVSEVAGNQRSESWDSLNAQLPANKVFTPTNGKPIEVLDIVPRADYDGTHVYHLPMGNALDENMTTRVAALAAAEPTKRVIAVGNPGSPGHGKGKIKARDFRSVWSGDLRAVVDPTLQYLNSQGIDTATHIGFSYGADRAAASAQYADRYDQQVPQGILMEPASIKERSLLGLAGDFGSTAKALDGYVQAAASPAYLEARKLAEKSGHGLFGYTLGLARMSNLAIAHALAKDGFEGRVDFALTAQPEMTVDIIWGSESELALHGLMLATTAKLIEKYGVDRVRATELEGQKHAMGDDIFLHTAMVLQSSKK